MKKIILIAIYLIFSNVYSQETSENNNYKNELRTFINGLKNPKVLSLREASEGFDYKLNYSDKTHYPKEFNIYYYQTFLEVSVSYNNTRVILPFGFDLGYATDGEMTWEKNNNEYIIGQYDFDDDKIDEIIIGLKSINEKESWEAIEFIVYKYYPPLFEKDNKRNENWKIYGDFKAEDILGNATATIYERSIKIPRNLRGMDYEWTFVKDDFIKTGDL